MTLGSTQPLTEMSTRGISRGERRPVRKADNRTAILYRCHVIWGTLTSWNPLGLSRPVMGLFYLYIYIYIYKLHYFRHPAFRNALSVKVKVGRSPYDFRLPLRSSRGLRLPGLLHSV